MFTIISSLCMIFFVKVIQLMSVDLLRQQSRWKEGLLEIRQIIAHLVQQVEFDLYIFAEFSEYFLLTAASLQ